MEIFTIGGFNEVGKNMTVVQHKEDVFIFDMGVYLPAIVELQEQDTEHKEVSEKKLRNIGALPDDLILDKIGLRNKVRAIFLGHAHLDHIGAVPYIAYRYDAPLVGTPFTTTVLKKIMEDDNMNIPNDFIIDYDKTFDFLIIKKLKLLSRVKEFDIDYLVSKNNKITDYFPIKIEKFFKY